VIKLLSVLILVLAIALFPPAVLAYVSQNAIPGDTTYPIKRKLEDGILLIASVNPSTKAWFSVEVSNRRFKESAALLSSGKDADQTLVELVSQTAVAQQDISHVSNDNQKQQLTADLNTNVSKYIVALSQTQTASTQPSAQASASLPGSTTTAVSSSSQASITTTTSSPTPVVHPTTSTTQTQQPVQSAPIQSGSVTPSPSASSTTSTPTVDTATICANATNGSTNVDDTIKQLCGILSTNTVQQAAPTSTPPAQPSAVKPKEPTVKLKTNAVQATTAPIVYVTTCKNESVSWQSIDSQVKNAGFTGQLDHSQAELDAYNRAACPAAVTVKTCKGETKSWSDIDSELKNAGYGQNFDHSQTELDAYNKAACPSSTH